MDKKNSIHPYITKALNDGTVKSNLKKFIFNHAKRDFFIHMLKTRIVQRNAIYEDVLDMVRDASVHAIQIEESKIGESVDFYNHKFQKEDMKRQTYNVYISPRTK